jgi:hypothetical protein
LDQTACPGVIFLEDYGMEKDFGLENNKVLIDI